MLNDVANLQKVSECVKKLLKFYLYKPAYLIYDK